MGACAVAAGAQAPLMLLACLVTLFELASDGQEHHLTITVDHRALETIAQPADTEPPAISLGDAH